MYFLVTTADERTWESDKPLLFLGEWCKPYNIKHKLSKLDYKTAKPYGMDEISKDKSYKYICKTADLLLVELSEFLNKFHNTDYGIRYWNILLGHWLHRYVSIIFNRWFTLHDALCNYEISGTKVLIDDSYVLATQDSYSFIWACNDDLWNHMLYSKILKHQYASKVELIECGLENEKTLSFFNYITPSSNKSIKNKLLKCIGSFVQIFSRNQDAVIIKSYLSRKEAIKFQLKLGQVPQFWDSSDVHFTKPDILLRSACSLNLEGHNGFEQFVRAELLNMIPVCFFEGFNDLINKVSTLPWPKSPKFIFTSNSFDTDEVFKAWVANKTQQGTQYIVGQHGNNYGTYKYSSPTVEEVTADKFVTWGWSGGGKYTSAFIFKNYSHVKLKYNPAGKLLLIEDTMHHRLNSWDTSFEYKVYFEEQKLFVGELNEEIKQKLIIRLSPSHAQLNSFEVSRWHKYDNNIEINEGVGKIEDLVSESRIVVHSYDSTGMLETLSENIPTLAFWTGGLGHLKDEARPDFQNLVDAGIVHLSVQSIVDKINNVWNNVDGWWAQDAVQDARKIFCRKYARLSEKPALELYELLKGDICE